MISQSGKSIIQQFVTRTKELLLQSTLATLQEKYGIWEDGHKIPVEKLSTKDTDDIHVARMLRERLKHIVNSLPEETADKDKVAVGQLIAEQAFTILNRFCALRMCEERDLIFETIRGGYNSQGFLSYDAVTGGGAVGNQYTRYKWYLSSIFDELSVELPAVFDRYSQFCLIFPDETTLQNLLDLINADNLTAYYDAQTGETINFWQEDETIGWIYQYYNSLEERRKIREESSRPRNSREMAIRNQFFTPEYIVKFLTDNTLGRVWHEMTGGKSRIYEICEYMVRKPDEEIPFRALKEPTEIRTLDPTCGSMHFGLYAYSLYEYIYLDAWDNQPTLLAEYRYSLTRDEFKKMIPALILEHNIYGCEIDPRALQMAALSLWLRAQRSYNELQIPREERPLITHSNLVLAEGMPGNKKMFNILLSELDAPMQRLIKKIWEKMRFVGEAGLLIRMEKEIENEIDDLRKNWSKVARSQDLDIFSATLQRDIEESIKAAQFNRKEAKEEFFAQVTERLQDALLKISEQLSAEEGYENALFTEDATRGFAFIELCQQRFDVIVMNPPFGEGSENTYKYLNCTYKNWCRNLACAFFDRMKELLVDDGKVGAIFTRAALISSSYEDFRKEEVCGYTTLCIETGWNVLDASVETTTLVLNKNKSNQEGVFIDVLNIEPSEKGPTILSEIERVNCGEESIARFYNSNDFNRLPNTVIGYNFDKQILELFKRPSLEEKGIPARRGMTFVSEIHFRMFYEAGTNKALYHHIYRGGDFSLFYTVYRDLVVWEKDGEIASLYPNFRPTGADVQNMPGVGYGERGDIIDAHILKGNFFFTYEGESIPITSKEERFVILSYINSVVAQFTLNQYCQLHKVSGYVKLLPVPDYESVKSKIVERTSRIIDIKRGWLAKDETNLEYKGLIDKASSIQSISSFIDTLEQELRKDTNEYKSLVKQNDLEWIALSNADGDKAFLDKMLSYTQRRPQECLLSIDGASTSGIGRTIVSQEIIQELLGVAFGRWDVYCITGKKSVPISNNVFDPLPFMPIISLDTIPTDYPLSIPDDGILVQASDNPLSLVSRLRDAMHFIWGEKANVFEYELCKLIGIESLQGFFDNPNGFFDYHFRRYTKSRRKAPIYWPLSSAHGAFTVWVYYPRLSQNTLPQIVLLLGKEIEATKSELTAAQLNQDKVEENRLRVLLADLEGMITDLNAIIDLPYRPNHDDGIPVTAAPLAKFFQHTGWRNECLDNLEKLNSGEYDWSHLAYSMFPVRIREKAKKDWCLALTHGLEDICLNKPKAKKAKKSQDEDDSAKLFD